jgi:hypothetical protein
MLNLADNECDVQTQRHKSRTLVIADPRVVVEVSCAMVGLGGVDEVRHFVRNKVVLVESGG